MTSNTPQKGVERDIKITRNYSFWRHPIKWWKDRKKLAILDMYVNSLWKNGLREEVEQMQTDIMFSGAAFMKDGKRIDPKRFRPTPKSK